MISLGLSSSARISYPSRPRWARTLIHSIAPPLSNAARFAGLAFEITGTMGHAGALGVARISYPSRPRWARTLIHSIAPPLSNAARFAGLAFEMNGDDGTRERRGIISARRGKAPALRENGFSAARRVVAPCGFGRAFLPFLWNFSRDGLETAPLCFLHSKPARGSIAENYQEAFFTPGISPLYASSRKQIRQMP
jgi:hypothetical protein